MTFVRCYTSRKFPMSTSPPHGQTPTNLPPPVFTRADIPILTEAVRAAIEQSAPVIAKATTEVITEQMERAIGRGVIGWVKRGLIAVVILIAGWTYLKTGR
jgi:hypothetical protein